MVHRVCSLDVAENFYQRRLDSLGCEAITKRIEIPEERVFVNLHKYGNTSAAACAIALDEAHRDGRFGPGDHIVLVAFGAGLTWAAAAIRW